MPPQRCGEEEQFAYQHTQLDPSSQPQLNSAEMERQVCIGISFLSE